MRRSAVGLVTACALVVLSGAAYPQAPAPPPPALQKVGVTESVHRSLDYVSAKHSLTLSYPGASYVKVHFSRLSLLPGDWLTIADPTGGRARTYRFGLAGEWAMSVDGDTAALTRHGQVARLPRAGGAVEHG